MTDDLSAMSHRFDLEKTMRDRYPNFKVTYFTIPWDIRFNIDNKQGTPVTEYPDFCDHVKQAVDDGWMEIALHGLTHAPQEFLSLTYDEAKKRAMIGLKLFENKGIKTNGLFKAPFWLLNENAKKGVESLGLKVVEDGYYNWNLKDKMPKKKKLLAHGHIADGNGVDNGMDETLLNLFKVPENAEWVFLSEEL